MDEHLPQLPDAEPHELLGIAPEPLSHVLPAPKPLPVPAAKVLRGGGGGGGGVAQIH